MSGHVFAFDCPHCAATIAHRGSLRLGVAHCTGCGAQYRIDVRVAALTGPALTASRPGPIIRDPDAAATGLVAAIERAALKSRARKKAA